MSSRARCVVVAGTGTEVGKTWTAVHLLSLARAEGWRVAARKPAQSYSKDDATTDADLLGTASGEPPHTVCPAQRWYPVPMAPPMAADVLGKPPICVDELVAELRWPAALDLAIVETAGGLCSPIAHDADNLALIERLDPDLTLLVADAGLGTINAVRLCMRAMQGRRARVLLNRFDGSDELHRRNRHWLERDGFEVATEVALDLLR